MQRAVIFHFNLCDMALPYIAKYCIVSEVLLGNINFYLMKLGHKYDDSVFLPASALRTAVRGIGRWSLGQGPRFKQYLFNFHVFIYTVADACWLPAHRLPSLDFWLGSITMLHLSYCLLN